MVILSSNNIITATAYLLSSLFICGCSYIILLFLLYYGHTIIIFLTFGVPYILLLFYY